MDDERIEPPRGARYSPYWKNFLIRLGGHVDLGGKAVIAAAPITEWLRTGRWSDTLHWHWNLAAGILFVAIGFMLATEAER